MTQEPCPRVVPCLIKETRTIACGLSLCAYAIRKGTYSICEPLILFSHMFYVRNSIPKPKGKLTCDVYKEGSRGGLATQKKHAQIEKRSEHALI